MLVSWIGSDENDPDAHPLAWVSDLHADAWVLGFSDSTPLDHAARWNSHLTGDPDAFGEALDKWTAYIEELGGKTVSEGAILLHRRSGGEYTVRADSVEEDEIEVADEQIRRAFAARARLEDLDLLQRGSATRTSSSSRRRASCSRVGRSPWSRHRRSQPTSSSSSTAR